MALARIGCVCHLGFAIARDRGGRVETYKQQELQLSFYLVVMAQLTSTFQSLFRSHALLLQPSRLSLGKLPELAAEVLKLLLVIVLVRRGATKG